MQAPISPGGGEMRDALRHSATIYPTDKYTHLDIFKAWLRKKVHFPPEALRENVYDYYLS